MSKPLLEVRGLTKFFPIKQGFFNRTYGYVRAVDGVHFQVSTGETLGIVGESGCGKSTTGRSIIRLIEPTAGEVLFEGKDLVKLPNEVMRRMRKDIQIIFQDPYASLNPRKTIRQILLEPLHVHQVGTKAERIQNIEEMIEIVGLKKEHLDRYPHDFSGGQRQRIGIARALIVKPKLIIADEAVSALDVSIQAQILNLLKDLKKKLNLTVIFISHDLSVIKHTCDRVAVMYLGKIVEIADKQELFRNPCHPYTKALLSALPVADPLVKRARIILKGDLPSPTNPPSGCSFHTRCEYAKDICKSIAPTLTEIYAGQLVSCHFVQEGNDHIALHEDTWRKEVKHEL